MRKYSLILIFIALSLFVTSCSNQPISAGEKLFGQAQTLEKMADYIQALNIYQQALPLLRQAGKDKLVKQSLYSTTKLVKITMTYNLTEEAVRQMIKESFPETTNQRIDEIIVAGHLPHMAFSGKTYYFSDFLNTLYHIYPEFRSNPQPGALGKSLSFFKVMSKYIYEKDTAKPGQTLVNPINYLAEGNLTVPRDKLPQKGLLKVWLPLPLITAAQPNVEILSIYPRKYIKYPLKLDGDIGLVYLEIPVEELKDDLKIGLKLKFTHYEERFKVDPNNIGEYDKNSPLYKRYTASEKNIAITSDIRKTAKRLAGKETNPYKIAKIFFDYIIWDLDYSFTPHAALEALNIAESVFVHEHGYGDCGAQSMYFAALCRAMGIPARAPGGRQLFPVNKAGNGSHFWAQIYLPNYGWFPVDTSAGQIAKYFSNITEQQKHDFANYYFGNMDPFRYLNQKNVDIPLIPKPDGALIFAMVLQDPTALCAEMDENLGLFFSDNWNFTVKQVD